MSDPLSLQVCGYLYVEYGFEMDLEVADRSNHACRMYNMATNRFGNDIPRNAYQFADIPRKGSTSSGGPPPRKASRFHIPLPTPVRGAARAANSRQCAG